MLRLNSVAANIAVSDLKNAQEFYGARLGLEPVQKMEGAMAFKASDHSILQVYEKPGVAPSDNTCCTFEVDDLPGAVKAVEEAGITFEEYDTPDIQTQGAMATVGQHQAAWFKDPDGNILCLHATGQD